VLVSDAADLASHIDTSGRRTRARAAISVIVRRSDVVVDNALLPDTGPDGTCAESEVITLAYRPRISH
jgi:regulator of extracellular matrix RemA (YlzA/DUF370 family)